MVPMKLLTKALAAGGAAATVLATLSARRQRRAAERQIRTIATSLQANLLPRGLDELAGVDIAVRYEAGMEHAHVGGDWCDAFPVGDQRVMLTVGDVSGHGVAALVTMAGILPSIRAHALTDSDPASILDRLHVQLRQTGDSLLCTACIVRLDLVDGTAEMAVAGHPPAIVLAAEGGSQIVDGTSGVLLGPDVDVEHDVHRFELGRCETLALYSDGLVERRGEVIDTGIGRLRRVLEGATGTVDEMVHQVFDDLVREGPAQEDDAVLLLCRRGGGCPPEDGSSGSTG